MMTSETDTFKTNEFLHRRKLRILQVREQSKDVAKSIRQRAKAETLKQVVNIDAEKQKAYLAKQEKLVKRLDVLYKKGLTNVGASHQSAIQITQVSGPDNKTDISKLRGKEAAAALRKKRQDKLDEQKKLLDRKLQAREAANEISREKSSVVASKLLETNTETNICDVIPTQNPASTTESLKQNKAVNSKDAENLIDDSNLKTKSNGGTEQDVEMSIEEVVPDLLLLRDDSHSLKINEPSKPESSKRLDLFALSKEMPADLCGRQASMSEKREKMKSSLTLVSEYLQTRKLRLRESEVRDTNSKHSEDISSLKQTILRTRPSKCEAPTKLSAGTNNSRPDGTFNRKSVVVYNHGTRDTRDLLQINEHLVVRDLQTEEDAYTQALSENSAIHKDDRTHQEKVLDMRHKAAVSKQTVEKEYRDTMNFLNSVARTGNSKVTKTVYMDEHSQQKQKNNLQRKMQHKYRQMEKECRRHQNLNMSCNSKSPSKHVEIDDDFDSKDYQYSWMPVPESDGNLAIHTIPNTVKEGKSGNSVKFSKVDNYHEYRSRHKHTPPTKDTASKRDDSNRNNESQDANDSNDESSFNSVISSSSVENLQLPKTSKDKKSTKLSDPNLSDAERIIIYKILDTKSCKKKNKLLNDIAKSLTSIEKIQKSALEDNHDESTKTTKTQKKHSDCRTKDAPFMPEQINEGIYKTKEDIGEQFSSMCCGPNGLDRDTETIKNRNCQHKTLSERQIKDQGNLLEWQDAAELQPMRSSKCCQCSTVPKEKAPQKDEEFVPATVSSASTSSSSFKTATNNKVNRETNENGPIKLVDTAEQTAAEFLLDRTAILKELAYEVIIQLRKKNGFKEEELGYTTEIEKKIDKPKDSVQQPIASVEIINSENSVGTPPGKEGTATNVVLTSSSLRERESKRKSALQLKQSETSEVIGQKNAMDQKTESENDRRTESEDVHLLKSCEDIKGVTHNEKMTRHDLSPNHFYVPSRSAKTTYTQTTNTPTHRNDYIHKSSSTSTTYMSPPEMVLPKYLKRDSSSTDNDTSCITDKHSGKYINRVKYPKIPSCSTKNHIKMNDSDYITLATPPNTVRSCRKHKFPSAGKCRHCVKTSHYDEVIDQAEWRCYYDVHNVRKKCTKHSNNCCEIHRKAQKRIISRNVAPKNKNVFTKTGQIKNCSKDSLNPIIKNYIDKLLNLNKDGLRVLEVGNQECSSITTPSSSIINVPCNIDESKSPVGNKISLEHVQKRLLTQVLSDHLRKRSTTSSSRHMHNTFSSNPITRKPRKKVLHKVKSVNISKHLNKKQNTEQSNSNKPTSTTTDCSKGFDTDKSNIKSQSLRTSKQSSSGTSLTKYIDFNSKKVVMPKSKNKSPCKREIRKKVITPKHLIEDFKHPTHNCSVTNIPPNLSTEYHEYYKHKSDAGFNMSTQTSQNNDTDFMKLAEDKLNNMEKIADLTEKCTKRLSSLAKVLDEVRKNKSIAYSHISGSDTADSQSDHKSDKIAQSPVDMEKNNVLNSSNIKPAQLKTQPDINHNKSSLENNTLVTDEPVKEHSENISYLTDIPKPALYKLIGRTITTPDTAQPISESPLHTNSIELANLRSKPPASLSRIQLKYDKEYIVPHELSTVVEVDSPMSIKNKNQSSRNDILNASHDDHKSVNDKNVSIKSKNVSANPDLLLGNTKLSKQLKLTNESSDDSNFKMIDLKHFNEIMLEPFISIHEYAKKYNVTSPEQGTKMEERKEDAIVDDIDISSLHSDGSLPDVIAELLKRNVITEPFKFDTASNINSTSVSSESTLSMLALSKARKVKKKSNVAFQNKENIVETSDSLSMSSNPDLENSFKKLGMGWASSTLKKTKERLALSSSSNTSRSSLSQFKIKSLNPDIPVVVTDSVPSVYFSKKVHSNFADNSKDAKQQTNFARNTTVKEFLTNELANKITFTTNTSGVNNTEQEFASLLETRMPEAFKQHVNEHSNDTIPSATNRARTSTPVQLFKSMTYHSSSCSNISNGLFSNADDLSSVKITSNSVKNHSTSDDLTIPNFSLKMKKVSDNSKSD